MAACFSCMQCPRDVVNQTACAANCLGNCASSTPSYPIQFLYLYLCSCHVAPLFIRKLTTVFTRHIIPFAAEDVDGERITIPTSEPVSAGNGKRKRHFSFPYDSKGALCSAAAHFSIPHCRKSGFGAITGCFSVGVGFTASRGCGSQQ